MLTAEKKRLQREIAMLPDEMVVQVVNYVEKLKHNYKDYGAPEELRIRSRKDLELKLNKGFADIKAGRTRPWNEVLADLRRRYS